jgi:transcriptional regulator with XRE-family HTH domain
VSSQTLAEAIGANCKRIRTSIGVTQDEVARYARDVGLKWNAAKVGNFEAGRSAPTFATVLLVSLALQHAAQVASGRRDDEMSDHPVTPADLVGSDGCVTLNDELPFSAEEVAAVCRGRAWTTGWFQHNRRYDDYLDSELGEQLRRLLPDDVAAKHVRPLSSNPNGRPELLWGRSGLAEDRLARRAGISRERLADISSQLWQRTFSEERDRRAGPDANQQKKGRISRELRAELEKAMTNGNA